MTDQNTTLAVKMKVGLVTLIDCPVEINAEIVKLVSCLTDDMPARFLPEGRAKHIHLGGSIRSLTLCN